jgi:hypothetical protein
MDLLGVEFLKGPEPPAGRDEHYLRIKVGGCELEHWRKRDRGPRKGSRRKRGVRGSRKGSRRGK